MPNAPDHYEVLGLRRTCTPEEIKTAYEELMLVHRPDKNPEDKESEEKTKAVSHPIFHYPLQKLTKQIKLAHEILSDSEKRKAYDASTSKLRPNAPAFEPGSFKNLPQIRPRLYPFEQSGTGEYHPPFQRWNNPMSNGYGNYRVARSFDYQVYYRDNNSKYGHV